MRRPPPRRGDLGLGLGALVLAGAWYVQAAAIEDSLLSDAVGAGGVPKVLAVVMGTVGALLALRALLGYGAAAAVRPAAAHAKAAGLLGLLVAYVLLVPLLGFALTVGLFAAAVALYAGAPRRPAVLGFGAGLAALFWLGFVKLLGVAFPAGALFGG